MFRLAAYLLSPAIFVAVLLAMTPAPAAAAVSAQFSLVGPASITAPCPVNVSFTGSINGMANTAVTYHFAHYTAGSWSYSSVINATIPSSGSLPITETLPVDAAHAGLQSNQVDTTVPNASEGKVFFTVTCSTAGTPPPSGIGRYGNVMRVIAGTPPPTGTPPPSGIRRLGYVLPAAPQNLRVTHDYHECLAHLINSQVPFENFSVVFCDGWNNGKNFYSALIWEPGSSRWFSLYVGGKRIIYDDPPGMPIPCCVWRNEIPTGGCAFVRAINVNQPDQPGQEPTDQSKWVESANSNTVCYVLSPMKALVPAPQPSR